MKKPFLIVLLLGLTAHAAWAQTFYADAFGDEHSSAMGWMAHEGQKLGTDMQRANGLHAYTDGYGMEFWLLEKSTFKLSKTLHDPVPNNNDTTFCVSVEAAGTAASSQSPQPYLPLPGFSNFYYPHTGTSAEEVPAYHRWVYWNAWPGISMQFYTSRGGPRLAIVCEPGSDPDDILLKFTGQDSLHVDINGMLKMCIENKCLELGQAIAYQVNGLTGIIPLPWLPTYVEENGVGQVSFAFGTYNPDKPLILQIGAPAMGAAWEPGDPRNLLWSTYAGSDNADEFMANDVDANGDVYATGYTYQANFPVGTGYQVFPPNNPLFAGSEDVVTMKFLAWNKQIAWATYQGGGGQATNAVDEWRGLDKAYDIAAYKGGNSALEYVFVTGATVNTDFPTIARDQTLFTNADTTSFAGGLSDTEHAAFILAYKEFNGHLDWSTTLGATPGDIWSADGLGVDVDEDGTLVWSGRASPVGAVGTFTYPLVTPAGAWTRGQGGGFFALFNSDYQIIWNTFFGTTCEISGVFDVKIAKSGSQNHPKAFLTGVTCEQEAPLLSFDVYQPPGDAGFFQPNFGGGERDAYLAVLNLETYQLEYSTFWGGNGDDIGIALETFATPPHGFKQIWVGGLSKSTDLDSDHLPAPGTGGLHQTTNAGDADGMLLAFHAQPNVNLLYGTLYGGPGSDAIFDLEAGSGCHGNSIHCQIYATGETSSATGIVLTQNDLLYQQDQLGNVQESDRRDAYILAMKIYDQVPIWTTYIGGLHADKGWGIAASEDELYLVGGTVSDQETFPLKEFNTAAPEDWYDGDLFNNSDYGFSGHYSFNNRTFYRPFAGTTLQYDPYPGSTFDAFIASFGISPQLSVAEEASARPALRPVMIAAEGLWSVTLPEGARSLRLYDATGRVLEERRAVANDRTQLIDLRPLAAGVYVIACGNAEGAVLSARLMKP